MLNEILKELSQYHRDRQTLLPYYIEKRLNKSYYTYLSELTEKVNIALRDESMRTTKKVIKKL